MIAAPIGTRMIRSCNEPFKWHFATQVRPIPTVGLDSKQMTT
jgi:hypothetical protein